MRAEWAAALLLLAGGAAAHDLGERVTFASSQETRFGVSRARAAGVVYYSGDSDPIPGAWDTVLVQGELPDPGLTLRASRAARGAAWRTMSVSRSPDGRFWAKVVLPRGAGALRLAAVDSGVNADHEVVFYEAVVYDSTAAEPASSETSPETLPGDPGAQPPPLRDRASWGAAAPRQAYDPDPTPWRWTLHHTDGRRPATPEQAEAEVRFTQSYHQNARGWIDIGYHFLVAPDGEIFEGRPIGTLGAHAKGANEGNVGVVLLGRHHPPANDAVTPAQMAALASIGRWLSKRWGVDAASLKGHRDYRPTECPGDGAYPKLDEIRRGVGGAARAAAAASARPGF